MLRATARIAAAASLAATFAATTVSARSCDAHLQAREMPLVGEPAPSAPSTHVVIPFLANATSASDLDYEGGECERTAGGDRMTCRFQQVFLTTSMIVPDTCLITTNRYERQFRRETPTRWVSIEGPAGECGVVDVVTLDDRGGVDWTKESHQAATKPDAAASCRSLDPQAVTMSSRGLRRPLPCRFVQPGALSR